MAAQTPSMNLIPSDEEIQLRQTVAGVARAFGHDYFVARAREGRAAEELWRAMADLGLLGVNLPAEYGGGGGTLSQLTIVMEELAAAGCPLQPLVYSQSIGGNILAKYGTEHQRDRWLRGLATGKLKLSFAITERGAGSNSQNLATSAKFVDGRFVVSGEKTYVSGVEGADAILVVARTGTDPVSGKGELSLFLVDPDARGLSRQPFPIAMVAPDKQWILTFDGVEVGKDALVGELHQGFKALFEGLNPERILSAALAVGIGRYALEEATAYAKTRVVWDVPIGAHQGVAHPLAEAAIKLQAARLLMEKSARSYDAGLPAGELANMAKFTAGEAGLECLDAAIQAHGGNGIALEFGLTDMWW
ncbi:MAG: acyl-CoA dehydrogenase family protein, partial [Sciscionella sp.]